MRKRLTRMSALGSPTAADSPVKYEYVELGRIQELENHKKSQM